MKPKKRRVPLEYLSAEATDRPAVRYVRHFLLLLSIQLLATLAVVLWMPDSRHLLSREDHLIENLSAILFLAASMSALILLVRRTEPRITFLTVAVLGLIGCLDEVSYGQRLFGFPIPSIAGVDIDGVHDLITVALQPFRQPREISATAWVVMGMGVAMALVGAGIAVFPRRRRLLAAARRLWLAPQGVAWLVFSAVLGTAIVLDERLIYGKRLAPVEEVLEMNAALALMLVCLCTVRAGRAQASSRRKPR